MRSIPAGAEINHCLRSYSVEPPGKSRWSDRQGRQLAIAKQASRFIPRATATVPQTGRCVRRSQSASHVPPPSCGARLWLRVSLHAESDPGRSTLLSLRFSRVRAGGPPATAIRLSPLGGTVRRASSFSARGVPLRQSLDPERLVLVRTMEATRATFRRRASSLGTPRCRRPTCTRHREPARRSTPARRSSASAGAGPADRRRSVLVPLIRAAPSRERRARRPLPKSSLGASSRTSGSSSLIGVNGEHSTVVTSPLYRPGRA